VDLPAGGLVLSQRLAEVLGVSAGDEVTVEVLEGQRPIHRLLVTGLVDDTLGLSAYMEIEALHRLMREGDVVSGASLLIDTAEEARLSARLKRLPAVAGAGFKRAVLQNFRDTLAANMNVSIFINVIFAGIIAFGVVYNAARIALSERSRDLASLRVLGFTRAEISSILLGELAVVTTAAIPLGLALGYGFAAWLVVAFDTELYRFPLVVSARTYLFATSGVVVATILSALVVRRRLDQLDLVAVLKTRE
jgi:putative ABC transport system permease protein